ncbi:hypothetical protein BH09SUM1_BH09SUM1_15770 [soil metagenome]
MLRNFSFLIENEIAGCAIPGASGRLSDDLQEATRAGITAVVSLTERPLMRAIVVESGVKYLHIPIEDFTAPTIEQIEHFIRFAEDVREDSGAVLVHCHGGIGRTGTMLAAYLVSRGQTAADAIREVRRKRPGSIETGEQEEVVAEYERRLLQKKRS